MSDDNTPGHIPSRGLSGMFRALRKYEREKGGAAAARRQEQTSGGRRASNRRKRG